MKNNIEVLTLDTDSATELSLIRNIGEKGIRITLVTFKSKGLNRLSKYIKDIIKVSNWNESLELFIDELIKIGEVNPFKYMIISASDFINLALAQNYETLCKFYYFPFKEAKVIELLINKEAFYVKMEDLNIIIPKTYKITIKDDLKDLINSEAMPLIIKPKYMFDKEFHEYFGSKILKILNLEDYRRLEKKLEIIYDKVIIQRLIKGNKNVAVYGYFKNNAFDAYCVIDKDEMSSWGTTIIGHSIENIKLKKYAESILCKIDYEGFAELEFIYDTEDESFKLLEINCRPVQWCRLCSKVTYPIESIPIQIINDNFNNDRAKQNLPAKYYIFYEMGTLELLQAGKIGFKDIYKYIRKPEYISMYWDSKDIIPSIRYRLSFLKTFLKIVIKSLISRKPIGAK
ncbi:hypothetical protein [Candidatus Clostridium radicumherbarum]|uniref:ATP-grasp domain-containing protein n=1 Tax=Candidatus Clostridium radicumherbarum TaxID=3381662 RepID=A0ABW8TQM6_9CLOT